MIAELQIAESTPDHALGSFRTACLFVWRKKTTARAVEALGELCAKHIEGAGRPGVLLGLVEPTSAPHEAEAKAAVAAMMRNDRGGRLVGSALVFEGQGFGAATVRFMATGLAMLARPAYPHRTFSSPADGARFLCEKLALAGGATAPFTEAELAAALSALRAAPVSPA